MTRLVLLVLFSSLFACAARAADEPQRPAGPGYHGVTLPTEAGTGEGKEIKVVIDTPHVKIATITLRGGTVLEEHSAPMPVTISALQGSGTVKMGDKSEPVNAGHMVVLAPNVAHSVVPEGKTDLILLVHHMKPAPAGRGPGRATGK